MSDFFSLEKKKLNYLPNFANLIGVYFEDHQMFNSSRK